MCNAKSEAGRSFEEVLDEAKQLPESAFQEPSGYQQEAVHCRDCCNSHMSMSNEGASLSGTLGNPGKGMGECCRVSARMGSASANLGTGGPTVRSHLSAQAFWMGLETAAVMVWWTSMGPAAQQ